MSSLGLLPALAGWQWALGAGCAALVGVAKTGVPGVGILVVPLMVIAVGDARASAGWLLPLLCVADLLAIIYYRRHAEARRLLGLLPWVLVGMVGGALALGLPERVLRPVVGSIVLAMVAAHIARRLREGRPVTDHWLRSAGFGTVAGFATTVANAAGPVMNVYLLSKRLPKEEFLAAGAWFFLLVNVSKLPIYAVRGMIDGRSLAFDACLLPAVLVGGLLGRGIQRRIPQRLFEAVVLTLTAGATLLLFV